MKCKGKSSNEIFQNSQSTPPSPVSLLSVLHFLMFPLYFRGSEDCKCPIMVKCVTTPNFLVFKWSPKNQTDVSIWIPDCKNVRLLNNSGFHMVGIWILTVFNCRSCNDKAIFKYSNHLNNGHPNTGFIWIPDTMIVRYSNGLVFKW